MAKAVLLKKGLISKMHKGNIRLFGDNFIKTGEIDKKYGQWLSNLLKERTDAAYEALREFDSEEALEAVKQAEDFIDEVKTLI